MHFYQNLTHLLPGKCFFACSASVLWAGISLMGALSFETTLIEDVVSPEAKSYPFEFPFENIGDVAIEITEVKTSCGCTTADLEQKIYAPGDAGVIKGTFSVGNRKGVQENKVRVLTKDLGQPEIQLALRLEIPQLVTMQPGLLLWRVGAEPEAKILTLTPNESLGVAILSVESDSVDFAVELLPKAEGSNSYEVVIAPLKTETSGRGLIRVSVGIGDADPKTIFAHALVR